MERTNLRHGKQELVSDDTEAPMQGDANSTTHGDSVQQTNVWLWEAAQGTKEQSHSRNDSCVECMKGDKRGGGHTEDPRCDQVVQSVLMIEELHARGS